jgi:hypothetical protein
LAYVIHVLIARSTASILFVLAAHCDNSVGSCRGFRKRHGMDGLRDRHWVYFTGSRDHFVFFDHLVHLSTLSLLDVNCYSYSTFEFNRY